MQLMLAWAAGFFDGEGSVSFKRGHGRYRVMQASVAQVDRRPLDAFREAVGIGDVRGPYGPYASTKQAYFQWSCNQRDVAALFEKLKPFLKLKMDQFERVFELHEKYKALPYGQRGAV